MQQEIITAIDFGSDKLSASVAVNDYNDQLQILSSKSCKAVGIEKGILIDIDKCRDAVKDLLIELELKLNIGITNVSIGISSRKTKIVQKEIELTLINGEITHKSIIETLEKCSLNNEIDTKEYVIDKLINYYVVDGKVVDENVLGLKCENAKVNITLVIADKDEIDKYYELFSKTQYKIEFIKSNILSGKQIFLNENDLKGECALVDVGAGVVDITLFNDYYMPVHMCSIPLGGNNISNDLAICTEIPFLEADDLKKEYSHNYKSLYTDNCKQIEIGAKIVSSKLFYEITNARIEEILNHINIELKNTGHFDRICSIILYGDGVSYFEDIKELVKGIFNTETKVVTGSDLGIKNSENITSLAIVKEVYDRLNLLGHDSNKEVPNNEDIEQLKVDETESLHYNEDENHLVKKLKGFFEKIF